MSALVFDRRTAQSAAVILAFLASIAVLASMWADLTPTSAAFSDQRVIAGNRLGAGSLDIEVGAQSAPFSADGLAPGDRVSGRLVLDNRGSLPLRYELSATSGDGALRDLLDLDSWVGNGDCASSAPAGARTWRPLADPAGLADSPAAGRLEPGDSVLICLGAHLPLSAPTSAQGRRLDMSIGVFAVHDVPDGAAAGKATR